MIRATKEEKEAQIDTIKQLHEAQQGLSIRTPSSSANALKATQEAALRNENLFEALMEACKVCSLVAERSRSHDGLV